VRKIFIVSIACFSVLFCCAQTVTDTFKTYLQTVPGSALQFKMVPVKAGSFLMGSNNKEKDRDADEGPQRNISISAFWMGAF
jgi:formylglycine-generating enzyme required for sulfatase activity